MREIQIECGDCSGTGLYCGFAEPNGTAVICHTCHGSGAQVIKCKMFTGRKPKHGITRVMTDGGLWMCRTGCEPSTISIKEFYEKVPCGKTK